MASRAPTKPVTAIYRRDEAIGRGNFGTVYKGTNRETKQLVAIKVLNLDTIEDDLVDIQQEISTLSQLSQSDAANITKYYGSFLHGTKLWIIMDLCAGGSVRTLLKAGKFEEKHISVVVREVCVALQYIHKEGIIHRDIKAANVLITNTGSVRLCDFGVAASMSTNKLKRSTVVGTPYWMAPEVITEGALYNTKADIWSLGVTVYEIATGNPPYSDQEVFRAIMLIPKQKPARLEGNQYSPALKEFVAACLDEHPDERSSAEELLKMKFVKNFRSQPTSCLREIVQRYMSWRERNNVRDSVAYIKGIKEGDSDDEGEDAGSDTESVWDFETSDVTTFDYGSMTPVRRSESPPLNDSFQQLNQYSYPSSQSQENTMKANHVQNNNNQPTGLDPEAPQSLMELFGDKYASSSNTPSSNMTSSQMTHVDYSNVPTQPTTPTVEIEIPNFDALESSVPSNSQPAAAPAPAPPQQRVPPPPHHVPRPPPSAPPAVPPQSAQRSRSNTASNAPTLKAASATNTSSSTTQGQGLPPVPSIPAAASQASSTNTSPTQNAFPPSAHNMLPPSMPHNSSAKRAPSPKRMAPRTASGASTNSSTSTASGTSSSTSSSSATTNVSNSPPKPAASAMKPIVRSKLHNESTNDESPSSSSTSASSSPPQTKPNNSPPTLDGDKKLAGPKKRAMKPPGMHIAMPPPSLPFQPPPPLSSSALQHPSSSDEEEPLSFPQLPKFDSAVLLDTTNKREVVQQLDCLLDSFSVGLASLEEGLYNLVI